MYAIPSSPPLPVVTPEDLGRATHASVMGAVTVVVHSALHSRPVIRVEVPLGLCFEGLLTPGRAEVIHLALEFGGVLHRGLVNDARIGCQAPPALSCPTGGVAAGQFCLSVSRAGFPASRG